MRFRRWSTRAPAALHTTFGQAVAATGRLFFSDPNLQNIPIRSEVGKKIRHAFVTDPGFHLVSADYSHDRATRVGSFFRGSGLPGGIPLGRRHPSPNRRGGFRCRRERRQRRAAAGGEGDYFGLVFGQTDLASARSCTSRRAEAHKYIENYFQRYGRVRGYMDATIADARRTSSVSTLLGRTRALPQSTPSAGRSATMPNESHATRPFRVRRPTS